MKAVANELASLLVPDNNSGLLDLVHAVFYVVHKETPSYSCSRTSSKMQSRVVNQILVVVHDVDCPKKSTSRNDDLRRLTPRKTPMNANVLVLDPREIP